MISLKFFPGLLLFFFTPVVYGQEVLKSPDQFLGYPLGSRFTPHEHVLDYFRYVESHSRRIRLETYGSTYEGRPLVTAYVGTPERIDHLESIAAANRRLAGLEPGSAELPPVTTVWLSYNVHGNEAASTEAALLTLYTLADERNETALQWLENVVVIIDPCLNPDGRERYVNWYRQTGGRRPSVDADTREHREPWPGGRSNHYYFDLNRDWAWQVQQESIQRIDLYHRWMPQVHVDYHEQGIEEPYYFSPAAEPFHQSITPWQREFQTLVGKNNAARFDREGWLYFTREVFDLLYPGFGDTWPTFNGAIGMTYEQGGSSRAGLAVLNADQDTLTLHDRLLHHHTTGLATIETAAQNKDRLLDAFRSYFETARNQPASRYKTYLLRSPDAERLQALVAFFDRQHIQYGTISHESTFKGYRYATAGTESVTARPGDLLVSAFQPKSVLLSVLFDPAPQLTDSLTYDITAWSLPYVYGVDAYASETTFTLSPWESSRSGETVTTIDRPYAYVTDWKNAGDVRLLAALLNAGVRVRSSDKSFQVAGRTFDAGSLIVTRAGNERLGAALDDTLRQITLRLGQSFVPVASGMVTRGADFGSASVRSIHRARVAVVSGPSVYSTALGEVWHFFDYDLNYPLALLPTEGLSPAVLQDFDVLILPNGAYGDVINDSFLQGLKSWIRAGGRLILMEDANETFAGKEGFDIQVRKDSTDEQKPEKTLKTYEQRERSAMEETVPGSIFQARLDSSHPLAYGYGNEYFTLKQSDKAYSYLKEGWNVGILGKDAHVSGFAGFKARKRLEETLGFGVQNLGRGAVIYLIDDPIFRGFWYNGRLLFGNAVFRDMGN